MIVNVELEFPRFWNPFLHYQYLLVQKSLIFRVIESEDIVPHIVQLGQQLHVLLIDQTEVQSLIELALDVMVDKPLEDFTMFLISEDVVIEELYLLVLDNALNVVANLQRTFVLRYFTEPAVADTSTSNETV